MAVLLDKTGTVLAAMTQVECMDTTTQAVEAVIEEQRTPMPDLWEESLSPNVGPLQYRYDLSICTNTKFYDDKFKQHLYKSFNKMVPECRELVDLIEHLIYLNYIR